MSWPQWSAPQPAVPPVLNPAQPVINSAPAVGPPGLQYTPEQWAQAQQQNWNQWAQWQQQYQQWHQQYGAEYQKSMNAIAQAQQTQMPNVAVPPPLPVEVKPPPPAEDPPPPLPYTAAAPPPPQPQPPPRYDPSTQPQPPPRYDNPAQPQPPSRYDNPAQPQPPSRYDNPAQPQSRYDNPAQPPSRYDPPGLPKLLEQRPSGHFQKSMNQNWSNNQNQNYRYGPDGGGQNNKRPYDQSFEHEAKRPLLNKPPGWQTQPPPLMQQQQQPPPLMQQRPPPEVIRARENPDELSEAEKKFDKQFADWEAQFNKWKEQNAEHPDKQQYREYEKKWESWRAQLLERREQMKRKRLGLTADSPRIKPNQGQPPSFNSPQQNFNQQGYNQPPPQGYNQPPPKVSQNLPPKQGLLPVPAAVSPALAPGFVKPPPTMNDEPLAFKEPKPVPELEDNVDDFIKPNVGGGIPGLDLVKDDPNPKSQKDDDVVLVDPEEKQREAKGPDFDAISKGINSILGDQKLLNMLSMVSQTQNPNQSDNLINTTSAIKDPANPEPMQATPFPEKSNQSFEEHSNHSEAYGQREFVNNFDDQTRSSFTMAHNEEMKFEPPGNFNRGPNQFPDKNRFAGIKGDRFAPNQDRFGPNDPQFNRGQDRFEPNRGRFGPDQDKFEPNRDRFGPDQDRFGSNQDRFEPNQDRSGPNQGRFEPNRDRFGPNQDRFGPRQDRFNPGKDRFGPNQDRFGPNQDRPGSGPMELFGPSDKFAPNQNNFGPNKDRFGPNKDKFGPGNNNRFGPNQDRFGPSQDKFGPKQDKFGPNQDKFGPNQDKFGPNQDKFGPNQDKFGPNQDKFGPNQGRFGPNQDKFGPNQNRFGPKDDKFGPNQDRFGPKGDRFGPNQDRFGPKEDRFGPNQDRFGPNADRFGPNQGKFGPKEDRFGPNQGKFGQKEERFGPGQGRFGPNEDRFGSNQGRFGPNQDKFGPNQKRFGANQDRSEPPLGDDFGQGGDFGGPYDENCDDYDYDEIAANFETDIPPHEGEEPWQQEPEFQPPQFDEPMGDPEPVEEPPPKPEEIFQAVNVIDYEHKSLKSTEPEVLIEPLFMFDYRHKALSRIPLPMRPKWLAEAVRNIREFEPPNVRPNLRRYPPPDNWRNDRYQENWSPHNRRGYEDRRYDNRQYEEPRGGKNDRNPPKWEEKKSYNEHQERKPQLQSMDFEEEKISDTEWPEDDELFPPEEEDKPEIPKFQKREEKPSFKSPALIEDIISPPGRYKRPPRIVIILRGPPGSGKTFLAKLIKDKEVENGGSAPRILSLDDYFMVEQEKEVTEEGKKVKVKEMIYEYEAEMEESYRTSLVKSFKKTITDGYFSFIIVDNVNDKVKYFGEMWSFAKQNGFQVYICQLDLDVQTCSKRNIHGRSESDIQKCVTNWEPTPAHHPVLDATSLLQSASIPEVEMEEVNSPESDVNNDQDGSEDQVARSKWDNFDCSVHNLAKLDGVSKPLRHRTMEEYLQLDTDWTPGKPARPGQKRVRWADLEEQKQQEKMRAIGFVVGQTNWNRMMDPTGGSSALTQTKYIERTGRYKVDPK